VWHMAFLRSALAGGLEASLYQKTLIDTAVLLGEHLPRARRTARGVKESP
jgi:hypothetical protein